MMKTTIVLLSLLVSSFSYASQVLKVRGGKFIFSMEGKSYKIGEALEVRNKGKLIARAQVTKIGKTKSLAQITEGKVSLGASVMAVKKAKADNKIYLKKSSPKTRVVQKKTTTTRKEVIVGKRGWKAHRFSVTFGGGFRSFANFDGSFANIPIDYAFDASMDINAEIAFRLLENLGVYFGGAGIFVQVNQPLAGGDESFLKMNSFFGLQLYLPMFGGELFGRAGYDWLARTGEFNIDSNVTSKMSGSGFHVGAGFNYPIDRNKFIQLLADFKTIGISSIESTSGFLSYDTDPSDSMDSLGVHMKFGIKF